MLFILITILCKIYGSDPKTDSIIYWEGYNHLRIQTIKPHLPQWHNIPLMGSLIGLGCLPAPRFCSYKHKSKSLFAIKIMEVTEGATGGTAPGFHKVELLRTTWEMPVNYQDPQPLGVGAYGQVW